MMIIKANEELFNKWNILGLQIQALKSIVQNDMNISEKELREWMEMVENLHHALECLATLTYSYIEQINE